jgi:hypothetical protein
MEDFIKNIKKEIEKIMTEESQNLTNILNNESFYYSSGTEIENDYAYKTYKIKFLNYLKVERESDLISEMKNVLEKIRKNKESKITIYTIIGKRDTFVCFFFSKINLLIGIVKVNTLNFEKVKTINNDYKMRNLQEIYKKYR